MNKLQFVSLVIETDCLGSLCVIKFEYGLSIFFMLGYRFTELPGEFICPLY